MKQRLNSERKQRLVELESMLHQSNISAKNLRRLTLLRRHPDPQVSALATCILEVASIAPRKLNRWQHISSEHPQVFERAQAVIGQVCFEKFVAGHGHSGPELEAQLPLLPQKPSLSTAPHQASLATNGRAQPPAPPARQSLEARNGGPDRPHVEIYTDGGCEPNPGPGGYGVVLVHPKKRAESWGAFRRTTNNRMEILAAIKGLEMLKQPCKVTLYSDSQYLVKAISQGWAARWKRNGWRLSTKEPAKNVDLWDSLLALCSVHHVQFKWIKGHAGHRENERCDVLCSQAKHQKDLAPDHGYEAACARKLDLV